MRLMRLMRLMIKTDTTFTADDIIALDGLVSQAVMDKVALASKAALNDDVDSLEGYISDNAFKSILRATPVEIKKPQPAPSRPSNAALAYLLLEMLSEDTGKLKKPRFRVGDAVYVKPYTTFGRVIDINGGLYMVRYTDGKYVSSFPENELEPV